MSDELNTAASAPEENAAGTPAEQPDAPEEKAAETSTEKPKKHLTRRQRVKKILKYVGWTFGVLFLLLLVAILFRDRIAEFGTRVIGSWLTGAPVKVRRIETSLFGGTLKISDFTMGNPTGYTTERQAVELGELYVNINIRSLFTKKIVVEEVRVSALRVNCELNANGCNFIDVYNNILKKTKSDKEKKPKKAEEEPQVVVRLFKLENINVAINAIPLPTINYEKKDIGEEGGTSWESLQQDCLKLVQSPAGQLVDLGSGVIDKFKGLF